MIHLAADKVDAVRRFLSRAVETQTVWVLINPNGRGMTVASNHLDEATVALVWSAAAYARRHANVESAGGHPGPWREQPVPLHVFIAQVLPGLSEHGHLVGVEFDGDLAGMEMRPGALSTALAEVLEGRPPTLTFVTG